MMLRVKLRKFLIGIIILLSLISFVQKKIFSQYSEYEIKAAMIGKFTLFIDWPEKIIKDSRTFNICVLGKSPITRYLKIYYEKNKLKNLPVKIKKISGYKKLLKGNCHILFLSSKVKSEKKSLDIFKGKPVLIVGDNDKFIYSGAQICFYIKNDAVKFKINYKLMKESNLKVSYLLLNVGEVIEQ